jgi:hypothetical protein
VTEPIPPTIQAGRLLQILGWISIALLLVIVFVFPARSTGPTAERFTPFEMMIGFLNYSVLCLIAGGAIKRYRPWGKVLGVVLSVISLPYFPFGTLLGVWSLIYLHRGWADAPGI